MRFKYLLRFKSNNQYFTRYIKARSKKEAFIKLLEAHKVNHIDYIELQGDPLPTNQLTATELIKKKELAKEKQRQGRIKYYQLTGKRVYDK